ncbi:hypothetical protein [Streptomyces sp. SID13726]|uniref:hypothetical protein n=1 Tax=Streptomyces sp. SID13726 TaxID=2706058 RepID=UPI0013B746B7|nr:hypothetical protein [Streptomyces sp. SID13726]NEA99947.1 hypothetical protein [Streptomyces sp. SID13726]
MAPDDGDPPGNDDVWLELARTCAASWLAVTSGRNNPLTLKAEPVGDGFAFFVRLTPHGDDDVCHLQMEIDPIATSELRETFSALQTVSERITSCTDLERSRTVERAEELFVGEGEVP